MPVFLEDLIEEFYEPVGPTFRRTFVPGQIFWTYIGYTREDLQLWRPCAYDVPQTSATAFELVTAGADAFDRRTPLVTPPLATNEEFLAVRAKRRPVILLSVAPPRPDIQELRHGGRIYRPLALIVPMYSLMDRLTDTLKYPLAFVEHLRLLTYPEFLYLPGRAPILRSPGYARVGELQAVHQAHLHPEDLKLNDEVLQILQGQVTYLTTRYYGNRLAAYREQLQNQGTP